MGDRSTLQPLDVGGPLCRRMTAIANANWFRKLAWQALRDGAARPEHRAANARAAARIIIRQAKREALVNRMADDARQADLGSVASAALSSTR